MNVARYTERLQGGLSLSVEHVHDAVRITRNIIQEHGKTKNGWRIEGTNESDVARFWCLKAEGGAETEAEPARTPLVSLQIIDRAVWPAA
jgi:hypothetical protein